jgi:hypothetical protein
MKRIFISILLLIFFFSGKTQISKDYIFNNNHIYVASFGGKADGVDYSDGEITASSSTFTSDSANFTPIDVGKYIAVAGAGAGGAELITTIATYVNESTITLTISASTTVSSANFKFGTNNTAIIQQAINYACNLRTSTLVFDYGRYFLAGSPITNVGGYNPNSQLYIPRNNYAPSAEQRVLKMLGVTPPNLFIDFAAGQVAPNAGTILESVINDSAACILNTIPDTALYGIFNWRMLYIENLQFRNKSNNQTIDIKAKMSGVDLEHQNFVALKNLRIHTNSATESSVKPDTCTFGLKLPAINNGGNNQVDNIAIQGYFNGLIINENTNCDNLTISACWVGIRYDSSYHASNINRALITWCPYKIRVAGISYFDIQQLDIEHYSIGDKWFNDIVDLDEIYASNSIGNINYFIQLAYGGQSISTFTRTGNYITSGIKATPIGGLISHKFVNATDQEARIGSMKTSNGTFQLIVDGTGQANLVFAFGGIKKWTEGIGLISGKNDLFLYNYTRAKVDQYIDTLGNFRFGGGINSSSAQTEPQFELIRADSSAIFHGKVTTNDNALVFERQSSTFPTITLQNKAAGTNEKVWDIYVGANTFNLRTMSDDRSTAANVLNITRSGITPLYSVFTGGNVGIGVATPSEKLEVGGNGIFGTGVVKIGTLLGFTHALEVGTDAGNHPEIVMRFSSAGTDEKNWDFYTDATSFNLRTLNDAVSAAGIGLSITRSGNSPQYFKIPTAAVGINVATPTEKLEVGGNAVIGTTGVKLGTGLNFTHSMNVGELGNLPSLGFHHSAAGSDAKNWEIYANGNDLVMRTLNDAVNNAANILTINRTGFSVNYFRHDSKLRLAVADSGTATGGYLFRDFATGEVRLGSGGDGNGIYTGNGSLSGNTTITGVGNTLTLTGTQSSLYAFNVTNTGNGGAGSFSANGTGSAITGANSSSGNGVLATSSSGNGINATSVTGLAGRFKITPSSTNTVVSVLDIIAGTSGTAAVGRGCAINLQTTDDAGNDVTGVSLRSVFTSAATGATSSEFQINTTNAGSATTKFTLKAGGQLRAHLYGAGTFTGTATTSALFDGSGNVVEEIAPKKYICLLSQAGTSDPTATVLGTNSVGSIVWARTGVGNYTGTLTGAFTANKVAIFTGLSDEGGSGILIVRLERIDDNTIALFTSADGTSGTDVWTNISVKIEVYP